MASYRQLVRSGRRDLVIVQRGESFYLASASKITEKSQGQRDVAPFGHAHASVEEAVLRGGNFGYQPGEIPLYTGHQATG